MSSRTASIVVLKKGVSFQAQSWRTLTSIISGSNHSLYLDIKFSWKRCRSFTCKSGPSSMTALELSSVTQRRLLNWDCCAFGLQFWKTALLMRFCERHNKYKSVRNTLERCYCYDGWSMFMWCRSLLLGDRIEDTDLMRSAEHIHKSLLCHSDKNGSVSSGQHVIFALLNAADNLSISNKKQIHRFLAHMYDVAEDKVQMSELMDRYRCSHSLQNITYLQSPLSMNPI